jgi:hypothetical protein
MATFKTELKKTGVFFTVDVEKVWQRNVQDFMAKVAEKGEADVRGQMRAGEPSRYPLGGGLRPNRVSGHVVGRTVSLAGKQWKKTAVVSVNNSGLTKAQGIKLMAAASWIESQGHPFRKTAGRLRRAAGVNTADLLKGLR